MKVTYIGRLTSRLYYRGAATGKEYIFNKTGSVAVFDDRDLHTLDDKVFQLEKKVKKTKEKPEAKTDKVK